MTINVPSEIGAVLSELASKLGVVAEYLGETILAAAMTTAMPPAFPPVLRDKMLRLMGGCEHTWRPAADAHTYECECGMTWQSADLARQPLPAVGDGHEPTMEELFDLARRFGHAHIRFSTFRLDDGTRVEQAELDEYPLWRGIGATPAIALANAIAEAVKEVPA